MPILLPLLRTALAPLLALSALGAGAASPIVDTAYVVQALGRDAIVWDVRPAGAYQQGHIPGAVNVGDVGKALRNEHSEDYLPRAAIESVLGGAGIDPSREVVVYGAKASPSVYFALLSLQYFGGREPRIYHGGIEDWKAAGQPLSTDATRRAPVRLELKPQPGLLVETADMLRIARQGGVQIVDARTPQEFRGEDIRALQGGHIPGAVSIPYVENWVDPQAREKLAARQTSSFEGLNLKPRAQLQALYGRLDPNRETVVYCQSGVRAAETAAILKDIGFKDVKVYDSSWIGYGNLPDAPIENRSVFNLGALQDKVDTILARLDALTKELAAVKAGK